MMISRSERIRSSSSKKCKSIEAIENFKFSSQSNALVITLFFQLLLFLASCHQLSHSSSQLRAGHYPPTSNRHPSALRGGEATNLGELSSSSSRLASDSLSDQFWLQNFLSWPRRWPRDRSNSPAIEEEAEETGGGDEGVRVKELPRIGRRNTIQQEEDFDGSGVEDELETNTPTTNNNSQPTIIRGQRKYWIPIESRANSRALRPPNSAVIISREHAVEDESAHYARSHSKMSQSLLLEGQSSSGPLNRNEADIETFYIRKGANGTLPCLPVPSADSQATMNKIEWFKEEKKLLEAEAKHIVVWNTKNTIAYLPESGQLLFRGVTNEDSGEYHCLLTRTASGSGGPNSADSGPPIAEDGVVRFYVQDQPDPPQMPVFTSFSQRTINVSWVPSYDYHYSPILHYIIHVREGVDGPWDITNGIMTPDNRTHYEIIGLKPFTTYSFRVLAVNSIGVSEPSPVSHYIITLRQKPDSRLNIISARNTSSSSIKLEWLPPSKDEIHGEFLGYRIRYVPQLHEHAPPQQPAGNQSFANIYHSSSDRSSSIMSNNNQRNQQQPSLDGPLAKEIIVGDPSQTSHTIKGLQTFTPYKISVQVTNPAGDGPVAEVLAMTDEGVPSAPTDLSLMKLMDTMVKLRWSEPRNPNGILQGYQITLHDITNNLNDTRKLSDPQSVMEHTFGQLTPHTWYKVSVQAYSRKFLGDPSQQVKFRTDVSNPSRAQHVNVTCYSKDSILIQWQRPEKFYNSLDYYYVQYQLESARDFEETILQAKKDKLVSELLITNLTANAQYELKVIAGTKSIMDSNLVYKSEPSPTLRVVLQPNCESYTASPVTENTIHSSLAIGVVCASCALLLVTGLLVFWRRHCQAAYYYLDDPGQSGSRATNSPQLSTTYDDTEYGSVPVSDWVKHVQKLHSDGDIGFAKEFEQIQKSDKNLALTYEHSLLEDNKHKNRYINIVAYDHTRVTLRQMPGQQKKAGFDYVNANFIDGYNKPRGYIGTQGPLVSTFDDYWRMIWEQRVIIIVMITNLQERGRRKCDMYWPKEGSETYGFIEVKLLQEVVMATYTLRTFVAKNLRMKKKSVGNERTVYQYHYTNWPDHGVPDHPLPVLSFVRKSASANPPGAGAIICHCSAGCGRSGTYIVIDAMLKQIRHRQSINVVDFLKHIRLQRNYLVQTEEQYVFIHDALVEAVESGETEIGAAFIGKYLQLLQTGGSMAALAATSTTNTLSQKNSNYSITNGIQSPSSQQQQQPNSQLTVSLPNGDTHPNQMTTSQSGASLLHVNGRNNNNSTTTTTNRSSLAAGQWSLLERQYRLVASFKAKDFNVVSALKPCNKVKNRTLNLIPLEAHRVHITPKPGIDGSDYINATFLMGFNHLREFIITQHPVYDTFSDFWQMVFDHNSRAVVLLTPMSDKNSIEFPQFWSEKEDEVDYGSFKVKFTQESTQVKSDNGGVIITREFIMRSNQDDYELQTRIIHCPGWPECCGTLLSLFELITAVQSATQQQASKQKMHDRHTTTTTVTIGQEHEPQNVGPVIVVDKFGGTEAATFAVLTTLYKQINFEDAVDVYMYAKLAHLRRPGIWNSQDDYLFLYRAIEIYASSLPQQVAKNQSSPTTANQVGGANINYHHQTMTLDRHKHKSSNASAGAHMKSSTLRRPNTNNHVHQQNMNNHSPIPIQPIHSFQNKDLTMTINGGQILIDHNYNQVITGGNLAQPMTNYMSIQKNQPQQHQQFQLQQHSQLLHLKPNNNNNNNNNNFNNNNISLQNNNSSPYSSAVSIGANSQQHLLATQASTKRNQKLQQQQQSVA